MHFEIVAVYSAFDNKENWHKYIFRFVLYTFIAFY